MFSNRVLLNLGLVALLGILITVALINNKADTSLSPFSLLKKNDVASIQIKYNDINTQIVKSGDTWNIIQPVTVEADEFRVQAILNILSEKGTTFYDINLSDYEKFSLSPPLVTLSLNQQLFLFGSTSTVNNKRYVLSNNKLFLIDDIYYPLMTSGYMNLMRRQLFASNTSFREIKFDHTRVFQDEKFAWQAENNPTSADDLKKFVNNWQHIQAYAVTTAQEPYAGTRVMFTTAENKTTERLIQKTDINTVVINPELGLSYQFDISAYNSLTKPGYFSTDNTK